MNSEIYLKHFRCPCSECLLLTAHFITVSNFDESFTTQFAQHVIDVFPVRTEVGIGRWTERKYGKANIRQWSECFLGKSFRCRTTQRIESIHFADHVDFAEIGAWICPHEWFRRYDCAATNTSQMSHILWLRIRGHDMHSNSSKFDTDESCPVGSSQLSWEIFTRQWNWLWKMTRMKTNVQRFQLYWKCDRIVTAQCVGHEWN